LGEGRREKERGIGQKLHSDSDCDRDEVPIAVIVIGLGVLLSNRGRACISIGGWISRQRWGLL
jgi:hypothetical protein